jgi:hypothetical protein
MKKSEEKYIDERLASIRQVILKLIDEIYKDEKIDVSQYVEFKSLKDHYEYVEAQISKIVKLYKYLLEDSVLKNQERAFKQDKKMDKLVDRIFTSNNFGFKEIALKDKRMDFLEYFLIGKRDSSFANSYILNVLLRTIGVSNHIVRKQGKDAYYFNVVKIDGNWYYFDLTQDIIDSIKNNVTEMNHMCIGEIEQYGYKDATIMPINVYEYVEYGFYTKQDDIANMSISKEYFQEDNQKTLSKIYN